MKRLTTLLAVVLMAATGLTAQNVAPRGLFKLQRLGYENGRPDHVPEMVQYKLSTDYVPMTLMVRKNTPQTQRGCRLPDEQVHHRVLRPQEHGAADGAKHRDAADEAQEGVAPLCRQLAHGRQLRPGGRRAHPESPDDSSFQGLRREGRHLPLLLASAADGRHRLLQTAGGQVGQLHQGGRQQRVYHHLEE